MSDRGLSRWFAPDCGVELAAALDTALQSILETARAEWPGVEVADDDFCRYLAERTPRTDAVAQALAGMATSDLYLACACAQGDSLGVREFERCFGERIERALVRFQAPAAVIAEVHQTLLQQLLVSADGTARGIENYAGRGSLASWVRVAAVHLAMRHLHRGRREIADEARLLEAAAKGSGDPELEYLKQQYRQQFRAAFHQALGLLEARERNLLRHHLVDGMSIDELGQRFGIHRATAARWLERVRAALADSTRDILVEQLDVSVTEYESIVRIVQSQLDFTVAR